MLDDDPENGWAYFYRGMAELNISDEKFLTNVDWNNHKTFRMARRFADAELNAKIDQLIADYIAAERKRREEEAAAAERKRREALLSLSSDGKTLQKCNDEKIIDVPIPDSVTKIDDWAFENCSSLQSVTIPDSVTTIGDMAFSGCSSLHSVTIGNCVTTIGNSAFYNCSSLQSVTIPYSVTESGAEAFEGTALKEVRVPRNCKYSKFFLWRSFPADCKVIKY